MFIEVPEIRKARGDEGALVCVAVVKCVRGRKNRKKEAANGGVPMDVMGHGDGDGDGEEEEARRRLLVG